MSIFQWETAEEMNMKLALRVKNIRKRRKLTQKDLSERSNVSYGTIKRFETTGMISLLSLTRLAIALDCTNEITNMFTTVAYRNIEEVINEQR